MAKARKKWFEEDYEEFDRVFINKNRKKSDISEIQRSKNRTISKMKHMSKHDLMNIYSKDEEFF